MASRKDDDMTTAFIERFHSRDQRLWKKRKESNSYRICLEHQYGGRFIVLEHRYGRRFIVLEHQYGSNDVMWKRFITSRVVWSLVWNVIRHFTSPPTGDKARETLLPPAELERRPCSDISVFAWKQRWDFSQFSKKYIRVYTSRFLIAFARGHENAIVTDSNITLWEHAHIMVTLSVTIFFSKVSVFNHPLGSFSTMTATAPRTAKNQ